VKVWSNVAASAIMPESNRWSGVVFSPDVQSVVASHHLSMLLCRGYSLQERLYEISLSPSTAMKNITPIDLQSQTKNPKNVEQLKPIQKVIEAKLEKNSKSTIKPPKMHMAPKKTNK
jgi:hypothetical protein